MVVSFMGTGVAHMILGTYLLLSAITDIDLSTVHWIPVSSFSLMLFIGSCGALPIPFVVLSEILPDKVSIQIQNSKSQTQFNVEHSATKYFCIFALIDTGHWNNIMFVRIMGADVCNGQRISAIHRFG